MMMENFFLKCEEKGNEQFERFKTEYLAHSISSSVKSDDGTTGDVPQISARIIMFQETRLN